MTNAMKVNMNNNTIIITNAFAKKAEIFGTPEFRQLMAAIKEIEELVGAKPTVVTAKKAKKSASIDEPKEKKIRPSYKMMYDFIKAEDENGLDEFKRQREMVRFGTTKYNATLDWFMEKYSKDAKYKDAFYALKSTVEAKASEEEPAKEDNTVEFKQAN